jgi:hypothetical protein
MVAFMLCVFKSDIILTICFQKNPSFQAKTLNGTSSALETASTQMGQGQTVQPNLDTGRQLGRTEK